MMSNTMMNFICSALLAAIFVICMIEAKPYLDVNGECRTDTELTKMCYFCGRVYKDDAYYELCCMGGSDISMQMRDFCASVYEEPKRGSYYY